MGTDVHAVFQARRNSRWENIKSKWARDRDYLLFSWLANVRNGFGFGGSPTYDTIEPISQPRGIPEDFGYMGFDQDLVPTGPPIDLERRLEGRVLTSGVIDAMFSGDDVPFDHASVEHKDENEPETNPSSHENKRESGARYKIVLVPEATIDDENALWLGDHGFSWLTADEILAANRPGIVAHTGVVSVEFYQTWDGKTPPTDWCAGISGEGVEIASMPSKITDTTTHVQIEWDSPDGLDYFVDEIRRLKEEHGEVRMIFGFDS